MTIQAIFPIPFFITKIKNFQEKKDKILQHPINHIVSGDDAYESKKVNYIDRDLISNILKNEFDQFSKELTGKNTNWKVPEYFWIQCYEQYGYHAAHNHGLLGFSGIVYLKFNKKEHLPTRFYSPLMNIFDGHHLSYLPDVEEGDMIIFPSFLMHESPINTSKEQRIILSLSGFFVNY